MKRVENNGLDSRPKKSGTYRSGEGPPRPRPTVDNFREGPLFPRIERAVQTILATSKVVRPVDVLIHMGCLTTEQLGDWQHGRVPYLEKVLATNLIKLSRMLRVLRMYVHTLNLKPSHTSYVRHGGGPRVPLRFTKTHEPNVEEACARHFVWPGKEPFHMPRAREPSALAATTKEDGGCPIASPERELAVGAVK